MSYYVTSKAVEKAMGRNALVNPASVGESLAEMVAEDPSLAQFYTPKKDEGPGIGQSILNSITDIGKAWVSKPGAAPAAAPSTMQKMLPVVAIGGVALLAIVLLKRKKA